MATFISAVVAFGESSESRLLRDAAVYGEERGVCKGALGSV